MRGHGRMRDGANDVFVSKMNPGGTSLVWSTYIGGSGGDFAFGLDVDDAGAAYIGGRTDSTDFPTTAGALQTTYGGGTSDGFVTKLSPNGTSLVYSTFIGGEGIDRGEIPEQEFDVEVDAAGVAYLVGTTLSSDFPTTPGADDTTLAGVRDPVIVRLSADGSQLLYSSFLGGIDFDFGMGIALGGAGAVYVCGRTHSADFATTGFGVVTGVHAYLAKLQFAPSPGAGADTIGFYQESTGVYFLKNTNASGPADLAFTFGGGGVGVVPITGDWDGDGDDTVGLYATANGTYFLANTNASGPAALTFSFGPGGAGTVPLGGDWDGA
jgi:hypothetical protein